MEEEEKQKEIDRRIEEQIRNGTWAVNANQTNATGNINGNATGETKNMQTQEDNGQNMDGDNIKLEKIEETANEDYDANGTKVEAIEVEISGVRVNDDDSTETRSMEMKTDENSQSSSMNAFDNQSRCPFRHVGNDNESTTTTTNGEQTTEVSQGSEDIPLNRQPVVLPGGIVMPPPRVESVNTSWKTQHLSPEQINDYCKKLFKFKTVNIMHFK